MKKGPQGLAILGTASDVGKSVICCGLLRIFHNRGIAVVPYKAQNMSNNSAVLVDQLEIGRAQYTQAQAARVEPQVEMNPVLIKPQADQTSQLVILGLPNGTLAGADFFSRAESLAQVAWEAFDHLLETPRYVIAEGAGSLAEVNLRDRDFTNLGLAQKKKLPVILVADIDRGGVFAQVVGSLAVISPEDRSLVKGILINRFRGNPDLFEDGVRWLEERTGLPILGVLPYVPGLRLPSEDACSLPSKLGSKAPIGPAVAVIQLPRISNFTDFEPWFQVPGLEVHFLAEPQSLEPYQLVILPGSKAVIPDLDWLKKTGWAKHIQRFHQQGGALLGICGGYQMLGEDLFDPEQIESEKTQAKGLGFLPLQTHFCPTKHLARSPVSWIGVEAEGYEIHQGVSRFSGTASPWLSTPSGPEGCVQNRVWGSYFHGLFDHPPFLALFLKEAIQFDWTPQDLGDPFDQLVEAIEPHLDVDQLLKIMEQGVS